MDEHKQAEPVNQSKMQRVRRLWLLRHGATDWNLAGQLCGQHDVPLAAEGRAQARWAARRLQSEQISRVYASDLVRAKQTAAIVMRSHSEPGTLHVDAAWREASFGEWEGLTFAQIAEHYGPQPGFFADPLHYTPPAGEPFSQLVQRVQAAFADLMQTAANDPESAGDILLVSHAGPLRVLLCTILGLPFERQWQLRLNHGSLSIVDFVPDGALESATLVTLNMRPPDRRPQVARSTAWQALAEGSSPHV